MNIGSLDDAIREINNYLSGSVYSPYFVFVNNSSNYKKILNKFTGYNFLYTSNFCSEDSFANYDNMKKALKQIKNNSFLLGVGDIIALGQEKFPFLSLKDFILPAKLVVICRGITQDISKLVQGDRKFNSRRYIKINDDLDYKVIIVPDKLKQKCCSFKSMLKSLENGHTGELFVCTTLSIQNSSKIFSAYDYLKHKNPSFSFDSKWLNDNQWQEYIENSELTLSNNLLHWRTFLYYKTNRIDNEYLRIVIQHSSNYEEYKKILVNHILSVSYKDSSYWTLYKSRKSLLKDLNYDASLFIMEAEQKGQDICYYLTDLTELEKNRILKCISSNRTIPENLNLIFPELNDYLCDYTFSGNKAELYTTYFKEYKQNKLFNYIPDKFLDKVDDLSEDGNRVYNTLPARNKVIEQFDNGNNCLWWIDGLGVEYLGYIQKKALEMGLHLSIKIGRAILPSLTDYNKSFYENWKGPKHEKIDELDNILHHGVRVALDTNSKDTPYYLIKQLEIISKTLKDIYNDLSSNRYKRIIIGSDHGASRLVVVHNSENQYVMNEKGKHSGRCCLASAIDKKPYSATKDYDLWVLANYDRFKGGRQGSTEVHGGATLEEVVVPIIDITLENNVQKPTPKIINSYFKLNRIQKIKPNATIFFPYDTNNVSIVIDNHRYIGTKIEGTEYNYKFIFDKIQKIGPYVATYFADDSKVGTINIKIESAIASYDKNEDDFFGF